jgi:hypothetical protein
MTGNATTGNWRSEGEESATFCEQKVAKKLYDSGSRALAPTQPEAQHNKSFLRRFFSKKRPLAC